MAVEWGCLYAFACIIRVRAAVHVFMAFELSCRPQQPKIAGSGPGVYTVGAPDNVLIVLSGPPSNPLKLSLQSNLGWSTTRPYTDKLVMLISPLHVVNHDN